MNNFKSLFKKKWLRSIGSKEINIEQMKEMEKDEVIIIDVRSPQEYNEGHIYGAISIPEYEIKKRITDVVQDKERKIIVYCSTGMRSKNAQIQLQKLGYDNVFNLKDGVII